MHLPKATQLIQGGVRIHTLKSGPIFTCHGFSHKLSNSDKKKVMQQILCKHLWGIVLQSENIVVNKIPQGPYSPDPVYYCLKYTLTHYQEHNSSSENGGYYEGNEAR